LRCPTITIDAVIFLIERLAGTLNAIADDGHYFVLQYLLCLGEREFFSCYYVSSTPPKFNFAMMISLLVCFIFSDEYYAMIL